MHPRHGYTALPANKNGLVLGLPLPRKRSPDGATTDCTLLLQTSNCRLQLIYRPQKDERLSGLGNIAQTDGDGAVWSEKDGDTRQCYVNSESINQQQ